VTGGAGTGKTVTALHRAAHLACQAAEQLWVTESAPSVLLTIFTVNLAEALIAHFDLLADDEDTRDHLYISYHGSPSAFLR
jgi:superfamily I DNA/RNA helicase